MRYTTGQVVKLDLSEQNQLLDAYVLACPYVTMTEDYSSHYDDNPDRPTNQTLWADCQLLNHETGVLRPNHNFYFNATGSMLADSIMPEGVTAEDDNPYHLEEPVVMIDDLTPTAASTINAIVEPTEANIAAIAAWAETVRLARAGTDELREAIS